jgi:hypothetical protein
MILQCLEESRDAIQADNDSNMAQAEIETVSSAKPVIMLAEKAAEKSEESGNTIAKEADKKRVVIDDFNQY